MSSNKEGNPEIVIISKNPQVEVILLDPINLNKLIKLNKPNNRNIGKTKKIKKYKKILPHHIWNDASCQVRA